MSVVEQLQSEWESRPVEVSDLISLMQLIEENWVTALEALGPALEAVENGTPAYGPLSFAFGSTIGLKHKSAVYLSCLDLFKRVSKDQANNLCFTAIRGGLHDQNRSRGLYFEKLKTLLAIDDGSVEHIRAAIETAEEAGREAESITKLFREGLEKLWNQFYMSEDEAQDDTACGDSEQEA